MRRLLIRPGAIGDCILCFPALEFLRTDYTEIWVPAPIVPLISFADRVCAISSTGLDRVGLADVPIDPALQARLQSFDEIVSWYGTNRVEFRSALESLGVRCRFHPALPAPAGTVPTATVPVVDFFCAQVGAPPDRIPRVALHAVPVPRDTIVIHPFSGSVKKNWPLLFFRELASRLPTKVEWLAGPEEVLPEAHRFESLRDLAEWLAGARLYIGNDSGITHLAAAIGVPVVALFGVTAAEVWAPRGHCITVLQQQSLTVQAAARLIEDLLAKVHSTLSEPL